jgi:uncharacterized membrane protein
MSSSIGAQSQRATSYEPPAGQSGAIASGHRIASLDVVRGLVMVLMAIDHVRVYSGLPAGGATAGIFFTRWMTHLAAPAFVFLAGAAAYLYGRRVESRGALSRFLLTRGAWLLLLELTVIRLAWTFNLDYRSYLLAGVIWMIGWCMILMAALVHLPTRAIAVLGLTIIAAHNVVDFFSASLRPAVEASPIAWLWQLLYFGFGSAIPLGGEGGPPLVVLYTIFPWIGVMAAGYAFGAVMELPPERRRALCLRLGLAATAAFILLRALDIYGDPRPWQTPGPMPAPFRFLNTTKYPASLSFLLMTLGPTILLVGLAERVRGWAMEALAVFGRVPFFYYLLHIPLIHALACLVSLVRLGEISPWLFANHPMWMPPAPPGYTWSLTLLYVVLAVTLALLYPACRWYAGVKSRGRSEWLTYL